MSNNINPVKPSERYVILDILRGIALLGICLANYPEFSLYTFQSSEVVGAMPTAHIDHIFRYFHYIFIEGKFYSIFSLLFGIGFSIIISSYKQKMGSGFSLFFRRMAVLFVIGLCHLYFLWAGDILILYAAIGFFLPLFINMSNKKLLIYSGILLLIPILVDALIVIFEWNLSASVITATQYFHDKTGITQDNFPVWLVNGENFIDILKFNLGGSFIRMQEFIEGNRVFKVLGLFLIGLYIGRNKIYTHLDDYKQQLRKIRNYGFLIGFPISCLMAWHILNSYPLGQVANSAMYALSVVPLSLAYVAVICLWYVSNKNSPVFNIMAAPGRMALTNYIGQSVFGIIIFYGIGFKLGATMGLIYVEFIALGVFALQIVLSYLWLRYFQFGPLEWIWRMLTYGKWLKLKK